MSKSGSLDTLDTIILAPTDNASSKNLLSFGSFFSSVEECLEVNNRYANLFSVQHREGLGMPPTVGSPAGMETA